MSNLQVLTLGSNPNLAFYAWRLQNTGACSVSMVNPSIDAGSINWSSSAFGKANQYHPYRCSQTLTQIVKGSIKFDIAIICCSSLQDFQTSCANLLPYLSDEAIVLVESTGYVNLEPFVTSSLPSRLNIRVGSIMNESDVKQLSPNHFVHQVRAEDNRIYLGTATNKLLASTTSFKRCFKLFQLAQEDSNGALALLKSTNPNEFMTYQWKLALPRIVFSPLSIIFETEFPQGLAAQILCKPLITGIINECFKIIKKMDCKLVKGFENEQNLMKNWSRCYPSVPDNADLTQSPSLFYKFYHRLDMELDLLLLQPILLGDDHGVKTPYLENLYSSMCQWNRLNSENSESIFFVRKTPGTNNARMNQLDADFDAKLREFDALNEQVQQLELKKASMMSYISEKDHMKSVLDSEVSELSHRLEGLKVDVQQQQKSYETKKRELEEYHVSHQRRVSELMAKEEELQKQNQKLATQSTGPKVPELPHKLPHTKAANGKSPRKSNPRDSTMTVPNENLQDLADIALYGAALNGELQPRSQDTFTSAEEDSGNYNNGSSREYDQPAHTNSIPGSFPNDEQQAQIQYSGHQNDPRYQEYRYQGQRGPEQRIDRTQSLGVDTRLQQGMNGHVPHVPNGYHQSPMDQQPPHGLPTNGMPPNALPPNLRVNSIGGVPKQYTGPPQGPPQGYVKQRQSSIPNSYSYYDQQRGFLPQNPGQSYGQYQPHYQGPPPNFQYNQPPPGVTSYNEPSFQYAAPIDPGVESRFKQQLRRPNRRSALPQMGTAGLEVGGRGGMPGANPQPANKHRSMQPMAPQHLGRASYGGYGIAGGPGGMPGGPAGAPAGAPTGGSTGYNANSNPSQPHPHQQPPRVASSQQFLQLPNSNVSSTSSMNTGDTPKTSDEASNGVRLQVPVADANAKPLGGLSSSNKDTWDSTTKKKKKGIFGKKK